VPTLIGCHTTCILVNICVEVILVNIFVRHFFSEAGISLLEKINIAEIIFKQESE